ncbi:MAG TPA: hypothetical protein VHT27_05910 [Solirubrobacteraceae bacterium]|jgi:hypothetical protein|nr:hypothetical protein [Solirubrobacteraceae bacterium]
MREILVVANRTLGGAKLLDLVRARAQGGDTRFRLVVPASDPSAGFVIYDEAVRESAQVRVDLALSSLAAEGIEATGEVGDADPFNATMDAVAERRPSEIIISTHPAVHSGWLRRDLIERIENASGLPVEHVVVDLEQEGLPFSVTLVIANKTSSGEELLAHLRGIAAGEGSHLFISVVPQVDGSGSSPKEARERLAKMLDRMQAAGMLGSGMIGDPDPYTAVMNALELFRVDRVVISTLPDERSGWLRSNLVERVRNATSLPVDHVVVGNPTTATAVPAA